MVLSPKDFQIHYEGFIMLFPHSVPADIMTAERAPSLPPSAPEAASGAARESSGTALTTPGACTRWPWPVSTGPAAGP